MELVVSGSTHLIHFLVIDLNAHNIHTTFLCLDPVFNSLASELGHIAQEFRRKIEDVKYLEPPFRNAIEKIYLHCTTF